MKPVCGRVDAAEKPPRTRFWAPSSMMLQAGILERATRPPATPVVEVAERENGNGEV